MNFLLHTLILLIKKLKEEKHSQIKQTNYCILKKQCKLLMNFNKMKNKKNQKKAWLKYLLYKLKNQKIFQIRVILYQKNCLCFKNQKKI